MRHGSDTQGSGPAKGKWCSTVPQQGAFWSVQPKLLGRALKPLCTEAAGAAHAPPKPGDRKALIHDALGQNPRPGPKGVPAHTAWLEAGREPLGGEPCQTGAWCSPCGHSPEQSSPLELQQISPCMCPEEPPSPRSCSPSTLPALAPSDQLPSPRTTQPSNPKVKKPPLILTLPLGPDICHLHGSPSLRSNLPTAGQLLCLGERNSPPLAWHSHFPHALPCSCEANLFLFSALSKASP